MEKVDKLTEIAEAAKQKAEQAEAEQDSKTVRQHARQPDSAALRVQGIGENRKEAREGEIKERGKQGEKNRREKKER